MDHTKILSRAWTMVWHYKVLWVFGFLFALAGGGSGLPSTPGSRGSSSGATSAATGAGTATLPNLPPALSDVPSNTIILAILVAILVALLFVVIATIVRVVAETAMIAGVDEIESTGAAITVRRGFRLGWSRQALRLFLTELVIFLVFGLGALLLLTLAASPLLLLLTNADALRAIAIGGAIVLVLSAILFIIVAALVLSLVLPYIQRRVVLGGQGVRASIRQGIKLVRGSLRDTGLMWLLLIAIGILWAIVKIPLVIVLVVLSVLVGGIPAGLIYLATQSTVAAVAVGLPLFLLVFVPAGSLVEGLFQIYKSSAWTLAYRDTLSRHGDLLPVNGN